MQGLAIDFHRLARDNFRRAFRIQFSLSRGTHLKPQRFVFQQLHNRIGQANLIARRDKQAGLPMFDAFRESTCDRSHDRARRRAGSVA